MEAILIYIGKYIIIPYVNLIINWNLKILMFICFWFLKKNLMSCFYYVFKCEELEITFYLTYKDYIFKRGFKW